MKISLTFLLILLGSAFSSPVSKKDIRNGEVLYPFGEDVGDVTTPREDDGASDAVATTHPFNYFGQDHRTMYVNNNGVISLEKPVQEYTPEKIPLTGGQTFMGPYWADVDNSKGGDVLYRQTTDPEILEQISRDINEQYRPDHPFTCVWAFIATWYRVPYFGSESDKVNTYQAVLAVGESKHSFVMFNYGEMQWTTGAASGGDPETGLGGIPAQAGFNSGNAKNYFSIPGSRTDDIVNIEKTTNVGKLGRWMFQVDNFTVKGIPKEVMEKMEAAKRAEEEAAKKKEEEEAAKKKAEEEAAKAAAAAEEAARQAAEEAAKKAAEEEAAKKKAEEEAAKKAAEEEAAKKKAEEEAAKKKAEEEAAKKKAEEEAAKKKAEEEAAKKAEEEAAKKKAEEEAAKKAEEEAAKKKAEEEAAKKAAEEEAAKKKAEEEAAKKKAEEEAAKKKAEEEAAKKKAEEEAAKKKAEEEAAKKKAEEEEEKKPDNPEPEEEEEEGEYEEYEEEDYEDCEEEEEEETGSWMKGIMDFFG